MFGSTVLEIATGLVFVFLLTSLICTAISDQISNVLKWRAIELEQGIRSFLLSGQAEEKLDKLAKKVVKVKDANGQEIEKYEDIKLVNLYQHPLIKSLAMEETGAQKIVRTLLRRNSADDMPNANSAPKEPILGTKNTVNIPTKIFVMALFDTIIPDPAGKTSIDKIRDSITNLPKESPLRDPLLAIVNGGDAKMDDLRTRTEAWFDNVMTQTTEIYKRNMWRVAVLIGILVSGILNVDTLSITSALWRDPALRASINAAATTAANNADQSKKAEGLNEVVAQLNNLYLPIGWQCQIDAAGKEQCRVPNDWAQAPQNVNHWLKVIGWIITGFAAAQGAPFWFDVLKKFTAKDTTTKDKPA